MFVAHLHSHPGRGDGKFCVICLVIWLGWIESHKRAYQQVATKIFNTSFSPIWLTVGESKMQTKEMIIQKSNRENAERDCVENSPGMLCAYLRARHSKEMTV
jgi:hypothetical protein